MSFADDMARLSPAERMRSCWECEHERDRGVAMIKGPSPNSTKTEKEGRSDPFLVHCPECGVEGFNYLIKQRAARDASEQQTS